MAALTASGVVVLGGFAGVEAAELIGTKQIRDGSVTSRDLRDGGITGKDVRDGTLTASDFPGALVGPKGQTGPPGVASNIRGARGADFVLQPQAYVGAAVDIAPFTTEVVSVQCPAGTLALSGGMANDTYYSMHVRTSEPLDGASGWASVVYNASDVVGTLGVYPWVICAPAT